MNFLYSIFILVHLVNGNLIYKSDGDVNIGFLINDCSIVNDSYVRTIVHSALWTCDRLNKLQFAGDIEIGIIIHQVCHLNDYYDAIYDLYRTSNEKYLLGIATDEDVPKTVDTLTDIFKIPLRKTERLHKYLLDASIKVSEALNWSNELNIIASNQTILRDFYHITRKKWMCVKKFHFFDSLNPSMLDTTKPLIIFEESHKISTILSHVSFTDEVHLLLVPLDGNIVQNAPDGSFLIQPLLADVAQPPQKVLPTPILFEVATSLLSFTNNLSEFLITACNETNYKLNCIRNLFDMHGYEGILSPEQVLRSLKIESLSDEFVYNIFRIDNVSSLKQDANTTTNIDYLKTEGFLNYIKVFTYGILNKNLTILEEVRANNFSKSQCLTTFENCILVCENFKSFELTKLFPRLNYFSSISFRMEPWVFGFLSVSILGVIVSISILIFIMTRFCRKQILEGNPILTVLLLIMVIFMFLGTIPFAIEGNKSFRYTVYLARALSVTLPYSFTFALLLARAILLATVSKEIGFMSHVSGTVQAFLTLFIFLVQCALSLQLSSKCENIFHDSLLIYLLSYNVALLLLLMFITPLISKTRRNYKEGRYFTISVCLMACCWSCWLPAFAVFDIAWRDPLLCIGLVSTASILLGTIFIPRTYLMTVSAAKERFTSALPSLATATSAIDIYRASTQPVYDCVNVAAINRNNSIQAEHLPQPPPDFYSAPEMSDEIDEFEVTNCNTPPPPNDKVTRF